MRLCLLLMLLHAPQQRFKHPIIRRVDAIQQARLGYLKRFCQGKCGVNFRFQIEIQRFTFVNR